MLIDHLVEFCDIRYRQLKPQNNCINCNHQNRCPGTCKNCLYEIHFPEKEENKANGRKEYNCPVLMNYYVCDYSFKYASEMLYLLRVCNSINRLDEYNILSIGCGGSPDLMAFETFIHERNDQKIINYLGLDRNGLWEPIHNGIQAYQSEIFNNINYTNIDANDYFLQPANHIFNILILQYVISYIHHDNPRTLFHFFDLLIDNFILHKQAGEPLIILVNDVNSCNRGRDFFNILASRISQRQLNPIISRYYFDYQIKAESQRFGIMHPTNNILYDIHERFELYDPWRVCSSAQMIIEIN